MARQSYSKFVRPEKVRRGLDSERDLDILEAVLRYRFSPTSELVRLVPGNEDVTHRRLRRLWERGLVNRFCFPGIRRHSEFSYYLDSRQALDLLLHHGRIPAVSSAMLELVRANAQKDYAGAVLRGQHMQLGFLKHELMLSRLHFMLEMAGRNSGGAVELAQWQQGGALAGHRVEVPKAVASRRNGQIVWSENGMREQLPVEPDALFTLRFKENGAGSRLAHFLYEADRGTMNLSDLLKKMRAYFHFIVRQGRHEQAFGVHPIRAVLFETTDEARGKKLIALVNHPLVAGPSKRAGLFWFTISTLFTEKPTRSPLPRYLEEPEVVFKPIWALPDHTLHRLSDQDNSVQYARETESPAPLLRSL